MNTKKEQLLFLEISVEDDQCKNLLFELYVDKNGKYFYF